MNVLLIAGVVLLGICAGLLVNYLSDVLPLTRRLSPPLCVHCNKTVPLARFVRYQHCLQCGASRTIRCLVVQSAYPAAFLWFLFMPPVRLGFWIAAGLLIYLGVVVVIDLEHRVVLHPVSLAGAFFGLAIGWKLRGLQPTLLGGMAGFVIMLGLYAAGEGFARFLAWMRKQKIDEVALGFGDVNLSGVLGLLLGWPGITAGLFLAIVLGGLISFGYILVAKVRRRYQMFTAIPYAPFLILGAVILLYRP